MTSDDRRAYAERVKFLRLSADMTQHDLAAAAGVSRPTIIGIESGDTIPQEDKLVRILGVLGVDVYAPEFGEQTDQWLSMIGTLIEAVPESRREPAVNAAMRELTAEIRANVAGAPDDEFSFTAEGPGQSALDLAAKKGTKKIDQ
jgi:transcriptional regulator with XRE-family HTH domain